VTGEGDNGPIGNVLVDVRAKRCDGTVSGGAIMRIGLVTDSLAHLPLEQLLPVSAAAGVTMLEFGCGNWSPAPHLNVDRLLASEAERVDFLAALSGLGLSISALNCSGNPLFPGAAGAAHRTVTSKTIRLAGLLSVRRVVMMSGCPGGPRDAHANWVTTAWPPEAARVLDWQWSEQLIPYWRGLVVEAAAAGVERLCLELHGQQHVYNVRTLFRLRDAVGPTVGANLDPSHLFWMGADPIAAVPALGEAIYHVHAKDTRINAAIASVHGLIDVTPMDCLEERAWSYVTLGRGHDVAWWRSFIGALRTARYDDVLSIEHEDIALPPWDGVRESIDLLRLAIA
jgi:sugar phosphate isomerase/epimerase